MTKCFDCGAGVREPHTYSCKWVAAEMVRVMRERAAGQQLLKSDAINPSHYRQGGIECIEAIEAALTPEEFRGYLKGQIFKYGWRLGHKDEPAQEAGKLHWYAERLKKFLEKQAQPAGANG